MGLMQILIITALTTVVWGQRPSFLPRPVGFPALTDRNDGLGDRFGEGDSKEKLPIEAGGDRDLVNRLSKMPIDKQPFWFINWKALEENRKNPQSYDLKPNTFIDPLRNPLDQEPARLDPAPPNRPTNQQNTPTQANDGTVNGIQPPQNNNDTLVNRRPAIDIANPEVARPLVSQINPAPTNTRNPDVTNINLQDLIDAAKINDSGKIKPIVSQPEDASPISVQTGKDKTSATAGDNVAKTPKPDLTNRNAGHGAPLKQRPYTGHKHHQGYVFT